MSNLCTNIVVLKSKDEHNLEVIAKRIKNFFECYYWDKEEDGSFSLEFDSQGTFPVLEMEKITKRNCPNDLYMQVVSYEMVTEYVGHHVFKNSKWVDKIAELTNK